MGSGILTPVLLTGEQRLLILGVQSRGDSERLTHSAIVQSQPDFLLHILPLPSANSVAIKRNF